MEWWFDFFDFHATVDLIWFTKSCTFHPIARYKFQCACERCNRGMSAVETRYFAPLGDETLAKRYAEFSAKFAAISSGPEAMQRFKEARELIKDLPEDSLARYEMHRKLASFVQIVEVRGHNRKRADLLCNDGFGIEIRH